MPYELAPLHSYVRFYQAVATQLRSAWEAIEQHRLRVRTELAPFAGPLVPHGFAALTAALADATVVPPMLGELWAPVDTEGLSATNDIYEVVGRFSFQGEEDTNLRRVQTLVAGARNEIAGQRARLAEIGRLPQQARVSAARLGSEEKARADTERARRGAAFEPLGDTLRSRAKQTIDGIRQVPLPDLTRAETSADEYKRYAAKVEGIYQTCLPFLRKAVASLFTFVGAEVPASWPDTLPLVAELPPELLSVPPSDSPELDRAMQTLRALADETEQLARAKDDAETSIARCEGEAAACETLANETELDVERATDVYDFTVLTEQVVAAAEAIAALGRQQAERVRATGLATQRYKSAEAGTQTLEAELALRAQQEAALSKQLADEQKSEPVLFGKDTWNARIAELRARIEDLRRTEAERAQALNQLKVDFASLSVEVQTAEQQQSLCERWVADAKAKEQGIQQQLRALATKLGGARPVAITRQAAEGALAALKSKQVEAGERRERLAGEMRRQRELVTRIVARQRQVEQERQHAQAQVHSAEVEATSGREEGLKRLATSRRAAVERHVGEVLGGLEKSLASVDAVFVDPARQLLVPAMDAASAPSAMVLAQAEKLEPIVAALGRELDPELVAAESTLAQIQREFCEAAATACRGAWA